MKKISNFIGKHLFLIIFIVLFGTLLIGVTYAYYAIIINAGETTSTMTIGGGELSASFVSSNTITVSNVVPSDSPIGYKDFTLTIKNKTTSSYKLYLKTIINLNTFIDTENDGVLYYDIYSGTNHDTVVQSKTLFPTIAKGKAILKELTIPANTNGTTNYRLNLYFPKSSKIQNKKGELSLNAKITIENTNDTYSSNTFSMVELLSNIDKTNNGLIVDNTEDQNLRYVGMSPKNYVVFGNDNELWRIVGIFNVIDSITGVTSKKIKLVRNQPIGIYSYHESSVSSLEWSSSILKRELNSDFIYSSLSSNQEWYVNDSSISNGIFDKSNVIKEKYFNLLSRSYWNVGDIYDSNFDVLTFYNKEKNIVDAGYVGLISVIDFIYASTNNNCLSSMDSYCAEYNWVFDMNAGTSDNDILFLTQFDQLVMAFKVDTGNLAYLELGMDIGNVYPSVYLNSDVIYNGGDGSSTNPYTLLTN